MRFMISYSLPIETIEERTSRFLETGAVPPAGIIMEGRWHSVCGALGWLVANTDDAQALYKWITDWADIIEFQVDPVILDEEAGAILQEKIG